MSKKELFRFDEYHSIYKYDAERNAYLFFGKKSNFTAAQIKSMKKGIDPTECETIENYEPLSE